MSLFDETETTPEPAPPQPVGGFIDTIDKRILNYCEQTFWETGYVPSPEVISDKLGIVKKRVLESFGSDKFKESLATRGIDLTPGISGKVLDPRQIMLANLLLNMHDRRSIREKLKIVQTSQQQYNAWMRQPQFVEYLRKRGEAMFKGSDHEAYLALTRAVSRGDVNALKLFFEMRGIYTPKLNIDVNIEAVMLRVVEVVSKHVTDPQVLVTIAEELEEVMPRRATTQTALSERVN